ncbi:MAG TPA: hypothetical protein VF075_10365 [Pyrinomonadaceae bacterium]
MAATSAENQQLSIHQRSTRIIVSAVVFLVVLFLVLPHVMDVQLPLFVRVLLMPAKLAAGVIKAMDAGPPCNNIGTPQHPICEGTPVDLLFGLGMVMVTILLYPVVTYLGLSLASKIIKHREL